MRTQGFLDPIAETAVAAMRKARREASRSGHRRLLLFAGASEWCRRSALAAVRDVALDEVLWVTDAAPPDYSAVAASQAKRELGQEWGVVVFDAFAGFDPDAFGAVSGTLCGGGVLILLTPPLPEWPSYPDPEHPQMAKGLHADTEVGGRFLTRFIGLLKDGRGVQVIQQGVALSLSPEEVAVSPPREGSVDDVCRTEDQRRAVEGVLHVAHGHRWRPLVLMSDRGRGKSAALGIAAARLLAGGKRRILVTAPSRETTVPLFAHAARQLPDLSHHRKGLQNDSGELLFMAPDALLRASVEADLLLVDEAAAIPPALLEGLLRRYARIVFATTVHGYEGSGRGFEVRFRQRLDRHTPEWRLLRLETPIRWAPDDPLERLVFDTLLLDATPAPDEALRTVHERDVVFSPLSQKALAADETLLRQVFGLLLLAHYRTTPRDLRQLLDSPGLVTFVLHRGDEVVAVALVAEEGGLEPSLATAIRAGRRRVRGHLIPQSLLAHLGVAGAGRPRCLRVVRIAVHPVLRRRGLGRRLLEGLRAYAQHEGMDYLGASFGASVELLRFWRQAGYLPVRVGVSRGARSGASPLMVLRAVSAEGGEVVVQARERFLTDFPHQLGGPLAGLDPALALALLKGEEPAPRVLAPADVEMLAAFAHAQRPFEPALGALWRLVCAVLPDSRWRGRQNDALLLAAVLQHRSWRDLASLSGSSGRREVVDALRLAVRELLEWYGDDAVTAAIREMKQEGVAEGPVGDTMDIRKESSK